jgi:hypothetical protein
MHGSDYSEQCTVLKFEFFADLSLLLSLKYNEFWFNFLHTSRSNSYLH